MELQITNCRKFRKNFLLLVLLPLLPSVSWAADNSRSDTLNILNYYINLDITDFAGKTIKGNCLITMTPKMNNITGVDLDLMMLTVDSVKVDGQSAGFTYLNDVIHATFASPKNAGDTFSVDVYYRGTPQTDPSPYGGGFYFSSGYAYNIGVGFAVDPHVFGRAWFPCFDNFVERSAYDFSITTDMTKKAFCNGILQSTVDNGNGTQTWNWKMDESIPTYLASVAVANYATVNWSYNGLNGNIPIVLNAVAADTTKLKNSFINLTKAVEAFEKNYGAHPFDRIGYNLVPTVGGAMEHATNIAYLNLLADGNLTYETTMAHELSHHWWGDLATCETAEDMWLNEGWASYSENVFVEHTYGKDRYQQDVRANHELVLHNAHIDDAGYRAVSGVPHDYTYGTTVYQKGADVIHTLRSYMGDTLFFSCIQSFLSAYSFKSMNSYQLRDELSSCSGVDLTSYFDNWIFAAGFPHFSIDSFRVATDTGGDNVASVFIRQRLHQAPALYSNVPLEITFYDANWNIQTAKLLMSGECTEFVVPFGSLYNPVFAAVDFDEKISDAITDEWQAVKTTGSKNFGTAKMNLSVSSVTDSALVRIEHHWIAPDRMKNPVAGLYLSKERYWKIDGVNFSNLQANATLIYNGKSASGGYLDNDLLANNKEDSLVMMYRPSPAEDWTMSDSSKVFYGSTTDKYGTVVIYNVQKGEYALAVFDASRTDTSSSQIPSSCVRIVSSATPEKVQPESGIALYPNPAGNMVRLELSNPDAHLLISVFNMEGQLVYEQKISSSRETVDISTREWSNGVYVLKLTGHEKRSEMKKMIVIH